MTDLSTPRTILLTCPKGLAPVLARETAGLGYDANEVSPFGVGLKGTAADAMRLNLHLRTAHRVLILLREFQAQNPDELYARASDIAWEKLLLPDGYFSVHSHLATEAVNDSRFANLRLKDAVADRMRRKTGRRPDSGPDKTRAVLFLHWVGNDCQVWLDSSGEPLNRRGYRKMPHSAPMQETLAAGVVMSGAFKPGMNFVNPMCGSGVLGIEAALIAQNRAPGLFRSNFGFMHVAGYDKKEFKRLRNQALKQIRPQTPGRFILTDHDPTAIKAARENAAQAGLEDRLEFNVCDFRETEIPQGPGVAVLNPEYGKRLGDEEKLAQTYRDIGDFFKQSCQGLTGYIFTGNLKLAKQVGLRAKRRIPFFTSRLECRLLEYELYSGTRKTKAPADQP